MSAIKYTSQLVGFSFARRAQTTSKRGRMGVVRGNLIQKFLRNYPNPQKQTQ